ncbi:hypothetical protein H6G01_09540 [Leptolyngbya sp. FACHB-17]|nr:hypothetical protein [Leptolyngbya sp. FACHB-17]
MKSLPNLGLWFWLSLPLLGMLFWTSSGWIVDRQLKQNNQSVESIQIKTVEIR